MSAPFSSLETEVAALRAENARLRRLLDLTPEQARPPAATQTGLFPVFEGEHGEVTGVSKIRRRVPVEEYLRLQRRYAHLFKPELRRDLIDRIQARADRNIARFGLLAEEEAE